MHILSVTVIRSSCRPALPAPPPGRYAAGGRLAHSPSGLSTCATNAAIAECRSDSTSRTAPKKAPVALLCEDTSRCNCFSELISRTSANP